MKANDPRASPGWMDEVGSGGGGGRVDGEVGWENQDGQLLP